MGQLPHVGNKPVGVLRVEDGHDAEQAVFGFGLVLVNRQPTALEPMPDFGEQAHETRSVRGGDDRFDLGGIVQQEVEEHLGHHGIFGAVAAGRQGGQYVLLRQPGQPGRTAPCGQQGQ